MYIASLPKITESLKRKGVRVSKNKVAKIMRENNIISIGNKKFKATTNSNHKLCDKNLNIFYSDGKLTLAYPHYKYY